MENYNRALFTQFEINLIELFERLQSTTVSAEENGIYYVDDGYENGYTKSALIEHCIHGINHWYAETDTADMLNNDFTLESVTDYLQLLLSAESDTTVLAVGNGYVAAPSTITAYLHEDYNHNKLLAIYDYEYCEKDVKNTLEQIFPTRPPQYRITFLYGFDRGEYNYSVTVGAETEAEAVTRALEKHKNECEYYWKPFKSIAVEECETETEETAETAEPHYTEPKTECFYTGGGVWCTVYQLSGLLSDYYYSFDNDTEYGCMTLYSHKADKECNDDEYAFYGVVKDIDIRSATIAEEAIYNAMKAEETRTLKQYDFI